MRFFDHQKHKKAKSESYDRKVTLFPGNNFQSLPKAVNDLQKELELRDAARFQNSINALIENKKAPKKSVGLFTLPKPASRKAQSKPEFEKDIKPRF